MPEVKREVRPIEVNYVCDACGNGMMAKTGAQVAGSAEIEHRCMICNHTQNFVGVHYPRIDYVGINENY